MRQIFTLISCLNIFLITTAQTSKAEGETIIVFRCRATSSLNEPLLVIDGVIKDKFDLKEIDPNDIESLNILKDATAAAIYGCRASSGVIIITTKNANQRLIKVKDIFSGEILPNATVELNYNENGNNISLYQQTDSLGCFITNKIVYGKEYELKVSSVGYKTFMAHINSKIVRKNYSVLLERNYSQLKEAIVTSTICYKKSTKIKGSSSAPEMCGYLGCGIGGISIIKTLSEEIVQQPGL